MLIDGRHMPFHFGASRGMADHNIQLFIYVHNTCSRGSVRETPALDGIAHSFTGMYNFERFL
jgi:hypothetical protein